VTLYLDENISPRVADTLRARGLDVVSGLEAGNTQLEDRAQLRYAAQDGRAIVTCDVVDFLELAREAIAENAQHSGIVLIPSSFGTDEFSAIADGIAQVVRRYPGGLAGMVVYLSRARRR
jgi:Domain of unknown function (DUF5615)